MSLSRHGGLGSLGDPLGLSGGLSSGVLVAPAPSINPNLLVKTEQFNAVAWAKTNCPVTANAGTDPLGGSTADLLDMSFGIGSQCSQTTTLACTTATGSRGVTLTGVSTRYALIGTVDGVHYTFSIWLVDASGAGTQLRFDAVGGFVKVSIKDTGDGATPFAWGAKLEIGNTATGDATNYGVVN